MPSASIAECGAGRGLQELPDDVLALVSAAMTARDVVMLGATCRKLRGACMADKLWLPQCQGLVSGVDLQSWRGAMPSFYSLWRFARSVRSLLGLWGHQNPELGNLVYVTWGFVSVVGCRIIPQELGPYGLDTGLLWAPVFEIIGRSDGSLAFLLHGREDEKEFCYPGRFLLSDPDPNVLLLEVEPLSHRSFPIHGVTPWSPNSPLYSYGLENSEDSGEEFSRRPSKVPVNARKGKKKSAEQIPFHRLGFGDRRRLLESVSPKMALEILPGFSKPLFPCTRRFEWIDNLKVLRRPDSCVRDLRLLAERRIRLLEMQNHGDVGRNSKKRLGSRFEGVVSEEILQGFCSGTTGLSRPRTRTSASSSVNCDPVPTFSLGASANGFDTKRKLGLARLVISKMKQIIGKPASGEFSRVVSGSNHTDRRVALQDFLKQSKRVGLLLHACKWNLSYYRAWPIMHTNQFALYRIPEQQPSEGRDYAGLWGGTFGWPPGQPTQDRPSNYRALYFLKLSYEETDEGPLLIATKVLEGTQYVTHPNGSAMFTAKVGEPSSAAFPWEKDNDGHPIDILHVFQGEGISNGYGFRYPGSRPGDLFVDSTGRLTFVWRESRAVLTMKRLDLQTLLENGERVPALPPVANFAYLTKSYSNVFRDLRDVTGWIH